MTKKCGTISTASTNRSDIHNENKS